MVKNVLKDAGQYLLSPRDMNTIELIPDLIEAGVASLKLEGRMKKTRICSCCCKFISSKKIDCILSENRFSRRCTKKIYHRFSIVILLQLI